jgi:DNA-binding phage protein
MRTNALSPQAQVVVRANTPEKRAEILTQILEKDGQETLNKTLQQILRYQQLSGETVVSEKTVEKFMEYRGE